MLACAIFLAIIFVLSKIFDLSKIISYILPKKVEVAVIKYFPFSAENSIEEWDEKILNKSVTYRIESRDNESYVHAISNSSCSALYHTIKLDVKRHPIISWKWYVNSFPEKKSVDNLLSKEEDDFAGRLYVIFSTVFFTKAKVIEYIWTKNLEIGTISSSPYSDNIKLIVVESGLKEDGQWICEERDIYKDYLEAFNSEPQSNIRAIAFMCDADSTGSSADALFDDIKIFYKK